MTQDKTIDKGTSGQTEANDKKGQMLKKLTSREIKLSYYWTQRNKGIVINFRIN